MIGLGKEKLKQHQIVFDQMMSHKTNLSEQSVALLKAIDFEKGLEEDIEALYQEEENCGKATN